MTASSAAGQSRAAAFELQAAAALAALLTPLNSTMIAVGLPSIRSDFDVGVGAMTLLVSIYLVVVAVMQPVAGRLGDAFGSLRIMAAGLVLLIIASAASALAWTFPLLVGTRALQGLASALVMPTAIAFLRKRTPNERLGSVLGTNGAALSAAAALGPVIGGVLLLGGGWELLFVANIPIAGVSLLWLLRLPADEGQGRGSFALDLPSLLLLAASFTGMVLLGTATRVDSPVVIVLGVAVLPLALLAYAWRYHRRGSGVVDLRLFGDGNFAAAAAGQALTNLVMYTILVSLPLYLSDLRGSSDQLISLVLFAMSAAMIVTSPLGGRLSDAWGRRPLVLAGSGVLLVAAIALAAVLDDPPLTLIVLPLLLVGLGMGITGAPRSSAALEAWPPERAGSVSGTFSMMRYVGSVTGAALIAGLLGSDPDEAGFRLLFAIMIGFAAANVLASSWLRDRRAGAVPADAVGAPGGG